MTESGLPESSSSQSPPDLRRLGPLLTRLCRRTADRATLVTTFLDHCINLVNAAGAVYFTGDLSEGPECSLLSRQANAIPGLEKQLSELARQALRDERNDFHQLPGSPFVALCCPLVGDRGVLVTLLVTDTKDLSSFLVILQLLAALLDLALDGSRDQAPSRPDNPLLPLLAQALAHSDTGKRLVTANQGFKTTAGAQLSVLALCPNGERVTIKAISDITATGARTEVIRLLEQGIRETALRGKPLLWPQAKKNSPASSSLILPEIGKKTDCGQILVLPLTRPEDGAYLLLGWSRPSRVRSFLARLEPCAPFLPLLFQAAAGPRPTSAWRRLTAHLQHPRKLATILVTACLLLSLLLPLPFRVHGRVQVQPAISRFIVSRYDGLLEKSLVRPGDRVSQGQLLARLDGREVELQLTAARTEREKAIKLRDQARAMGKTAEAQLAELDRLRLDQKVRQLTEQLEHLHITSPINGIVLSGDLQRAEGSPVRRGQTLYEIAPLEKIDIEVAISQKDISSIDLSQPVHVRFDGFPGQVISRTFDRIEPLGHVEGNDTYFIGSITIDNPGTRFKPGMKGEASIDVGTRSLGWILFRRPYLTLVNLQGSLW